MKNLALVALLVCTGAMAGCSPKGSQAEGTDHKPVPPPPGPPVPTPPPATVSFWDVRHSGRTIREWHDRARDKDLIKTEREEAYRQLGMAGRAGAAALFELLGASDADTVRPLDPQKWDARAVMPGWVRMKAAETLGRMGGNGQPSAPRLAQLMRRDPVVQVRATCAAALAGLGSREPVVVQELKGVLNSNDLFVWHGAVCALHRAQPLDQESVALLTKLSDADPYKIGRNDQEWAAVMNARMAAREALLKR